MFSSHTHTQKNEKKEQKAKTGAKSRGRKQHELGLRTVVVVRSQVFENPFIIFELVEALRVPGSEALGGLKEGSMLLYKPKHRQKKNEAEGGREKQSALLHKRKVCKAAYGVP